MAAPKNVPQDAKISSKMHRRSRSGCFTCRLRRKKCEEGKPSCRACKHLGLTCNYKRPMWWSNGEQRRAQKEIIKEIIKKTQLSKKAAQPPQPNLQMPSSHAPPVPPMSSVFSGPQTSPPSSSPPYSAGYNFVSPDGYFAVPPPPPPPAIGHPHYPMFSPYEVDIKTERQIFVNDVPTRKDSTISTFSTYQPPPLPNGNPAFPADSWVQHDYYESHSESLTEEPVDFNYFEFPHGPITPDHETVIDVEECDKYLLNHFFEKVLKLIFPVLDANQHGSARADVILPALESNRAYLHCCLSVSGTHLKATQRLEAEKIDGDIVRHRYAAISELCQALNEDSNHAQILEATLGMIFFQCSVGRANDALPDIPWHQHFQAVTSLVQKLQLHTSIVDPVSSGQMHPPFNLALTAWIDILGATMLGSTPAFSDTYRELNMSHRSAGLAELMGCDDHIMFLISETACLDVQKRENMHEVVLCKYIETLAAEITLSEPPPGTVQNCFSSTGAIRPKQLSTNITAIFRSAARIYLCALVPGFEPRQPSTCHIVSQFAELMDYIPAGPDGFDRSVVWPLLIAGSVSVAGSPFRAMFNDRCERLGDAAEFGSFGRVSELLNDIWQVNDAAEQRGEHQGVRWRDVMRQKGWDYLLI